MRQLVLASLLYLMVCSVALADQPPREGDFKPLFDGKTLKGWEGNLEFFRVQDGAIVAGTLDRRIPRNEFLASIDEFDNFELRFKARLTGQGKNAGVQFRSQRIPNNHEMIGYQCDIGSWSKGLIWGMIYDESRRRKMLTSVDQDELAKHVKADGWNQFVVRADGPHIQIWVNGFRTANYKEPDAKIPQRGRFGLQIHSGPPAECWYKDIELKEL